MKIAIGIILFFLTLPLNAQEIEITIFDFQKVENDYKVIFNNLNKEVDSISNKLMNNITDSQRDQLMTLHGTYEDKIFDDEKFLPVMESSIEIATADLNLFHENYVDAIHSFRSFLIENIDSLDLPEIIEYPFWPVRNNQFRTTIQTFKYVFNSIDRSISSYLFMIRYSLREGLLESLMVGKYLNQNEFFDYYGILKHGLTVRLQKKDWEAFKAYYAWLISVEQEYAEQRKAILQG